MNRSIWIALASVLVIAAGLPSRAFAQDNSCEYAFDNVCDEGVGCAAGTDADDCSGGGESAEACAGADDDDCEPPPASPAAVPDRQQAEQDPPAAPLPASADGAPSGLYLMQRYWIATRFLEHDSYLFRDGQVARSPNGDIADFDFAAARAKVPDSVGTYEMRGDTMAVAWANGQTEEAPLTPEGACFNWNTGNFCPAEPFRVAALDGAYAGGSGIATSFGTVAGARTYSFTPDGRYRLASAASLAGGMEGDESVASAGSTGEESGTYAIDGVTVTLSPDAGAPRSVAAFPFGDGAEGASPEYIVLDGTMMKRRN